MKCQIAGRSDDAEGNSATRRLAFVVGDTLGHFFPALAVANAYRRRLSDVNIVFFGPPNTGVELAERNGYRYCPVSGGQLARVGLAGRSWSALQTIIGLNEARRALRDLDTEMVVGFGGYSSGAVVLAGRILGVATAIHEGNVRAGLANRLLARFVHRVYLAHHALGRFPADRVCVTGWPIRPEIAALSTIGRSREGNRRLRMLVCSGSRGGTFLARNVPVLLGELVTRGFVVSVWHQCGDVTPEPLLEAYHRAGIDARVTPTIDDIAKAYHWADFAVVRGGAGTLAELAAAALPAMIIPLSDAAYDHQSWNALEFAAAGAALWTRESEFHSRAAAEQITEICSDPSRWASVSAAARRLAAPSAADAVVDDCERILSGQL